MIELKKMSPVAKNLFEQKNLRMLFEEEKSFYVEIKLDDKHYLFIENCDKFGGSQSEDYRPDLLTDNVLIEVMEYVNNDDLEGYEVLCNFRSEGIYTSLYTTVEYVIDEAKYIIKKRSNNYE